MNRYEPTVYRLAKTDGVQDDSSSSSDDDQDYDYRQMVAIGASSSGVKTTA